MSSRKPAPEISLDIQKLKLRLKQLEPEEQILAGLCFYESLSTGEIAALLQKDVEEVHMMLNTVFSKVLRLHPRKEQLHRITPDPF